MRNPKKGKQKKNNQKYSWLQSVLAVPGTVPSKCRHCAWFLARRRGSCPRWWRAASPAVAMASVSWAATARLWATASTVVPSTSTARTARFRPFVFVRWPPSCAPSARRSWATGRRSRWRTRSNCTAIASARPTPSSSTLRPSGSSAWASPCGCWPSAVALRVPSRAECTERRRTLSRRSDSRRSCAGWSSCRWTRSPEYLPSGATTPTSGSSRCLQILQLNCRIHYFFFCISRNMTS